MIAYVRLPRVSAKMESGQSASRARWELLGHAYCGVGSALAQASLATWLLGPFWWVPLLGALDLNVAVAAAGGQRPRRALSVVAVLADGVTAMLAAYALLECKMHAPSAASPDHDTVFSLGVDMCPHQVVEGGIAYAFLAALACYSCFGRIVQASRCARAMGDRTFPAWLDTSLYLAISMVSFPHAFGVGGAYGTGGAFRVFSSGLGSSARWIATMSGAAGAGLACTQLALGARGAEAPVAGAWWLAAARDALVCATCVAAWNAHSFAEDPPDDGGAAEAGLGAGLAAAAALLATRIATRHAMRAPPRRAEEKSANMQDNTSSLRHSYYSDLPRRRHPYTNPELRI